jgi:hypothetical protein
MEGIEKEDGRKMTGKADSSTEKSRLEERATEG